MLVRATSLSPGDVVSGSDSPVKDIRFANGSHGDRAQIIGGRGVETAYAVRVSFEDGTHSMVHPAKEIRVLSRSGATTYC